MLILLVGGLVAFVFDLVALGLSIAALASGKRAFAFPAVVLALGAIVFNLFDWLTIARGHGSRGDPISWDEDWPLYAIPAGQALVVLVAIVAVVLGKPLAKASPRP